MNDRVGGAVSILGPVVLLCSLLVVWQLAVWLFAIPHYLLPSPLMVFESLDKHKFELAVALCYTMRTMLLGYAIMVLLNTALIFIFAKSRWIEKFLHAYIVALKVIPVIVLAPFLILWFGLGIWSQVSIVVLLSFFPLFVAMQQGFAERREVSEQLFTLYGASSIARLLKLRLPLALPHIFAGLKTAAMLALTGTFLAEILTGSIGLGSEIINATRFFKTELAFAALLVAVAAGLSFYMLIVFIEKKVVFWQSVDAE